MILDFNNLSIKYKKLFDNSYIEMQSSYVDLLDNIDQNTTASPFKYLQTIFSRSILESELVYNCTVLFFLHSEFEGKSEVKKIIISNKHLKNVINRHKSFQNIKICVKSNKLNLIPNIVKKYLYIIFRNIPFAIMSIFSSSKVRKIKNKKDFALLDTFITSSMIENLKFTDRYYTNIEQYFDAKQREKILYLPTMPLYFTRRQLEEINNSSACKLIYKQDYLNFFDYLKPYRFLKETKFKKNKQFLFADFNITKLIKCEYETNKYKSYRAILDFIFVQKFCLEGNTPFTFINWNENRATGKALVSGFNKYSPTTFIKGYQGFQSSADYHFYICPTDLEIKNHLIPMEISVVGLGFKERLFKFTKNIKVEVAPSFRQAKFVSKVKTNKEKINIIVLMSSDSTCIDYLFQMLNAISDKLANIPNIEVFFKPHPISNLSDIKKYIKKFNISNNFKTNLLEQLSIEDILTFSDLVISIKTGATFEFISNGIPCIVISDNHITENPIPQIIPHELWELTYSSEELYQSILKFVKIIINKDQLVDVEKIRNQFYNLPTINNVQKFLPLY